MAKTTTTVDSDTVLKALRLWNGGNVETWPLAHLRLGIQSSNQAQSDSLADAGPAAHNRAILNEGLFVLETIAPEATALLRQRFEHQRDALAVAYSLNIAESSLYYRQRQAVSKLTDILAELETQANSTWQTRMAARLPMPSYTKLVGIEQAQNSVTEALLNSSEHFIVSIDGLGGIGKTALAHTIAQQLCTTTRFDEICWITAKQTHLSTMGRLQVESKRPALTSMMLIENLAEQLQIDDKDSSQIQKQLLVKELLQQRKCLVVVDNLETVADYHTLLPNLRGWSQPTKFLITSRHRLLHEPMVFSFSLKELPETAAFELIRLEARRTGFIELANAPKDALKRIYQAVGGNPLALKLIIGQARFYSLKQVLARFSDGPDKESRDELFDYIYLEIWESLPDTNKGTLLALTEAGQTGFDFAHLQMMTELPIDELNRSLEELILLSLVDLGGNLDERRYRLHRLTEVFLLRMFA